ncbi:uncharacterized protein LOC131640218 [Vicia villosa]|uniref:uncharacterized protein LOC131640218 n=1 Tax=Vicia villosa TaxID=3911 RepID=UPI00273AE1A8|nr:uncharacterized protein LOC131640218 [Vicia villosa]
MSILVNASVIKDFSMEKGLRQGDPLSPFLFVLVMEALTVLLKKSKDIGEFRGFRINGEKESILYGINLSDRYLEAASSFLSCEVGSLPFKFLGVRVGDNPRKLSMWKDRLTMLRKRLTVWRGKYLSMAGRVVLINSVLNAIPIYSLSFYKAPKKVLNEVRSIQS